MRIHRQDLDLSGYPSNRLRWKQSSTLPAASSNNVSARLSDKFENELGSFSAKLQRPQYFTSLKVTSSKSLKVTQVSSFELKHSISKLVSSTSVVSSASSISSVATVISETEVVSRVSLRVDVSYHSVAVAEPWYHPWAQVGVVDNPSSTKPIAPDCKYVQ